MPVEAVVSAALLRCKRLASHYKRSSALYGCFPSQSFWKARSPRKLFSHCYGVGRSRGVGRALGVGEGLGVAVGVGVGVGPCTSKEPTSMRLLTTREKPGPR